MFSSSIILPNERGLFSRVANGDAAAFETIFYHYLPRLQPFIQKMARAEEVTEEIVQDVFISLWKNRETLPGIENYSAYIFTIATNKTYNYLKSKARTAQKLQEAARLEKDFTNNTEETLDFHESLGIINKLVDQLPPQKKLIYKLTREEGLSHDQIAERLNISKNTVKNHLVETLKFLREQLGRTSGTHLLLIAILIKMRS